jgi:hypothetical protein
MHCDLGSDRKTLHAALDKLAESPGKETFFRSEWQQIAYDILRPVNCLGGAQETCDRVRKVQTLGAIRAYSEVTYKRNLARIAILRTLVKSLSGLDGRKALIYVSDGIATKPGELLHDLWYSRFGHIDGGFGDGYEELIGEYEPHWGFRRTRVPPVRPSGPIMQRYLGKVGGRWNSHHGGAREGGQ